MSDEARESEDLVMARSNVLACAYYAAVNYGSERAPKKMRDLIVAINLHLRIEGREKLKMLVEKGVIEGWKPCPTECQMRPGGLFHLKECENDPNSTIYRERQQKAQELLPGGRDGNGGWRAASLSLVGEDDLNTRDYYRGA